MLLFILIFKILQIYLIKLFLSFDTFVALKFQLNHGHVNKYDIPGDSLTGFIAYLLAKHKVGPAYF